MVANKISSRFLAGTRGLLRLTVPLLIIGISCTLMNIYDPALFDSITKSVSQHPSAFFLFRWGILFSLILIWPYFVLKMGRRFGATPEQILQWRKDTWRVGAWLIIVELLVCENLITKAIQLFGGS
jgi:hypothetical protein